MSAYSHVEGDSASWATGVSVQDHILNEPDAELGLGNAAGALAPPIEPAQAPSKHKVASLFHLLFKVLALAMYLFSSIFFDSFIIVFVVCVLLLAFDFWTVKNVTGRLLVGLRWWNEVREDGSSVWVFESKPDNRHVHPTDSKIFWGALYITPLIWVLLGLSVLFHPQWLLIVAVAVTFSGANVVGYYSCSRDQGQQVKSFITQRVLAAAVPSSVV